MSPYSPRLADARRRALSYAYPWRIWAYLLWLSEALPDPMDGLLFMTVCFGTLVFVFGVVMGFVWLWSINAGWLVWFILGWSTRVVLVPVGRGVRRVARAVQQVEQMYRPGLEQSAYLQEHDR